MSLRTYFKNKLGTIDMRSHKLLIDCNMAEGSSVSAHVIKLQGYIQRLEVLGIPFPMDFGTDTILKSLPPSFARFVMNYNMHGMNKTLAELFAMLKFSEKDRQ
jgi:hypothetical protein